MLALMKRIFPPVHTHPKRMPHEWSQWEDPFRPLEAHEEGCGPVRQMILVLDYERDGKKRMVVQ